MYNLEELTEFNQALIYAFESEPSPARMSGAETFEHALFPEAGQHEDMLQAYLYAQNIILPFIKEQGLDKIDEQLFLKWINTLHGFIGKNLFANYKQNSGEYTKQQVLRWHKGAQLNSDIVCYLAGIHSCKDKHDFAIFLPKQGIAEEDALPFIELLHKLKRDKKLKPHPSQLSFIDKNAPTAVGVITLHKLVVAYHGGKLSSKEKEVVDHITKICCFPYEIPSAMETFALDTLKQLRELDQENLPEITKFLGTLFYRFTEIHPFGNANGRTATCLVNIILRALKLPSILLRHPGEKENEASDYSIAIKQLDKTLEPLHALILKRVKTAMEVPFVHEQLKQIVALRVELSHVLKTIQQKHPLYDIESIQNKLSKSVEESLQSIEDMNTGSIIILKAILDIAVNEDKRLDTATNKPLLPVTLSPTDKKELISALEKLTGHSSWKATTKTDNLIAWLELKDQSNVVATDIAEQLKKLNVATVTSTNRADNGVPVVHCKAINIEKIIDLAKKMKIEHSKSESETFQL